MIQINDALLTELGLGSLPQDEKRSLLNHIYETLELRVGMRLADQMTNEQLDEFEKYFEARDEKGAFGWLETNFPNYKDIVQQEFDKLKTEVAQSAPQILSTAQDPSPPAPFDLTSPTTQPANPQPSAPLPPSGNPEPPVPPTAPLQPYAPGDDPDNPPKPTPSGTMPPQFPPQTPPPTPSI